MPKKGYTVVTINEDVMKKAQEYISKVNKEAGYKKIRNMTHFLEEAIVAFAAGQLAQESPDVVLQKIVKVAFERDELIGAVLKGFLELPAAEGRVKLRKVLSKKELEALRKLLEG